MSSASPGDQANGYTLTEHGWVRTPEPLVPSPVPMPPWQLALMIGVPGLLLFVAIVLDVFGLLG